MRHAGSPSANVVGAVDRDAKLAGMATDDTAVTAGASETVDLDRDVWRPFVAAYADLDIDALLDIYSDDLIRASEPTGTAQDRTAFAHDMAGFFSFAREQGDRFGIEFRFTERLVGDGVASERGVFRIIGSLANGEERRTFGAFHVFARIEQARWRIVADYDAPSDEAAFESAVPIVT